MLSTDSSARPVRAKSRSWRKSLAGRGEGSMNQSFGLWWVLLPLAERISARKDLRLFIHRGLASMGGIDAFPSAADLVARGREVGKGMVYYQSPWSPPHPRNQSNTPLPLAELIQLERHRRLLAKRPSALVSNMGMDGSFVHGFSRDWSPQPGTGIVRGDGMVTPAKYRQTFAR